MYYHCPYNLSQDALADNYCGDFRRQDSNAATEFGGCASCVYSWPREPVIDQDYDYERIREQGESLFEAWQEQIAQQLLESAMDETETPTPDQ